MVVEQLHAMAHAREQWSGMVRLHRHGTIVSAHRRQIGLLCRACTARYVRLEGSRLAYGSWIEVGVGLREDIAGEREPRQASHVAHANMFWSSFLIVTPPGLWFTYIIEYAINHGSAEPRVAGSSARSAHSPAHPLSSSVYTATLDCRGLSISSSQVATDFGDFRRGAGCQEKNEGTVPHLD